MLSTRCGRKIEKQRDKTTPCHNTQLGSRFTFLTLLRRERRRTDPERTFFLSVSVRSSVRRRHGLRNSHLSRACEALQHCVFSHFSFHTCGGENEKTQTARLFRKKRRADRHHELPSVWVSIVCEARIAKLPPVTSMRMCYSVQRRCLQGRSGSRPPCSCECSANATQGLVSCMTLCKNIPPPPPPPKKKETRPGLI